MSDALERADRVVALFSAVYFDCEGLIAAYFVGESRS
jgi:hypothetical protein